VAHRWAHWSGRDPRAASRVLISRQDREHAATLAAREQRAEQAGTTAIAHGDWIAAAELEEERVVRRHELAQLLLRERLEPADQS
jgi:hypothetical protein